ncbi:MAG TPA: HAD family hydrolase [Candidatus Merdisoma merdipullorum]|nr:HAD family hydrolase [Candidatus Merdisoma merdipullorum]
MKTYRHLVFDIDGTIIDSANINMLSLQETIRELRGEVMPLEELYFSFGIPGIRTMEILGIPEPQKALKLWIQNYTAFAERLGMPLFPGMRETLEKLQSQGVSLGIITSKIREEYDDCFGKRQLLEFFPCVVTASDTPKGKPNPDPMLEYLKRTGASPEEVLYFGDTAYDMDCARLAGVDHALVLWGCMNPEGIEATYRLERVEDILQFASKKQPDAEA